MKTNDGKRITKASLVLDYLTDGFGAKNGITSIEAISLFGATRLSAIMFNIRKKGYNVISNTEESMDRYGNVVRYSRYRIIPDVTEV